MKVINLISLICWGFVSLFVTFLMIAMVIPAGAVLYVSTILGAGILGLFGFNLRQIQLQEGFDFGWFLTVKKGYWRLFFGLFGLALLVVGLFGLIFPNLANDLGERHSMKIAALLVVLFWLALIFTFLGWALICFSEAVAYWRLKKLNGGLGSFALAILWILFSLLFCSLFLGVINDVFVSLSSTMQNWILLSFAVLTMIIGLWSGKYQDLKPFADEEKQN